MSESENPQADGPSSPLANRARLDPPLPLAYLAPMPDRTQKPVGPAPWGPQQGDGGGPKAPDVQKPDTKDLLQRMRKVDPNQSKRYKQRTGE
jgi:hypothetical protein